MKKVIAAFDGLKYSESTRDYALFLSGHCTFHLVGVFLEDFTYHSYKVYDLIREEGDQFENKVKVLDKKDAALRHESIADFEGACRKAGIEFSLHHDKSIAIQDLLHESIFADLLIISSSETLTHYNEKLPTRFVRDVLADTHCPVLVVPRRYKPIEKLILLYDGEPSSVYSIKMLSYTLSGLKQFPVEVVTVRPVKQSAHVPDNTLMKEFMRRHFPRASFTVLKGPAAIELEEFLTNQQENCLVALGAYSRGQLSRWFRESMADVLMKDLKVPLFVAHG
jgi:hypothetical protein